ncbi:MAG: ATP synthase subunit I [Smithellaceae bacterium]|nr:ATP synthase subunit I [Smithellaceae bacterium]
MIVGQIEKKIELSGWLLLTSVVGSSYLFMPGRFTVGLLLGGLISFLNFLWLRRDLKGFFRRDDGKGKLSMIMKSYLRFTLTAVLLYFIISRQWADVIGLLLGLSLVVLNIVITIWRERKNLLAGS